MNECLSEENLFFGAFFFFEMSSLMVFQLLGDHVYKRTAGLPPEEQMISPLPDIQIIDLEPDIEFMVLACDGIWNSMSSKEVVDFVRPRLIEKNEKVSKICEEVKIFNLVFFVCLFGVFSFRDLYFFLKMFDHCLAPNTLCDGTGCDNMTAIIVQFKESTFFKSKKRHLEVVDSESEISAKKTKTEDVSSTDSIGTTTTSQSNDTCFQEKSSSNSPDTTQ